MEGWHERANGYLVTRFTAAYQADNATGVSRCPSWIKAQSQVFPLSLSLMFSPQYHLFRLPILPHLAFAFNMSPIAYLPKAKDRLETVTSQVRESQLKPKRKLT